ncbi:hypothetical protein DFP72DRAFT_1090379 [Ephemerocybe angulata]|uniref:Uncharacterized protein n=1 Tax=Ephemerocybe angulata TaxID=980116 RepID=A0A8H6MD08_9AGAR|nr:hypothetical protein DFP72DRAFT_1090379 [Tulosesus angulatus]
MTLFIGRSDRGKIICLSSVFEFLGALQIPTVPLDPSGTYSAFSACPQALSGTIASRRVVELGLSAQQSESSLSLQLLMFRLSKRAFVADGTERMSIGIVASYEVEYGKCMTEDEAGTSWVSGPSTYVCLDATSIELDTRMKERILRASAQRIKTMFWAVQRVLRSLTGMHQFLGMTGWLIKRRKACAAPIKLLCEWDLGNCAFAKLGEREADRVEDFLTKRGQLPVKFRWSGILDLRQLVRLIRGRFHLPSGLASKNGFDTHSVFGGLRRGARRDWWVRDGDTLRRAAGAQRTEVGLEWPHQSCSISTPIGKNAES